MMDNELQAQVKHLSDVLDSLPDAISAISLPDRKLIFASRAFEHVYGYPIQRFLDDPTFFEQVVHPDDLEQVKQALQACFRDGHVEVEHRVVLPDGQVRWLQRRARITYGENGTPVQLNDATQDISSKKAAEDAKRISDEKFAKAFAASPDSIVISSLEDGTYLEVNDSFLRDTGFTREEIIGHSSIERSIWASAEERQRLVATLREHGFVRNMEAQYRRKSGETRHALISSEAIELDGKRCLLSIVRDIHDSKILEMNLRASEERFRLLVEQSPYAIGVHQNGKIVFVNPATERLLGASNSSELVGKPIQAVIHPDYWEFTRDHVARTLRGESGLFPTEDVFIRLDGTPIPVEVTATPFVLNGQPATQVIALDITGRKQAEATIMRFNRLYAVLSQINQAIVRITDEKTLYEETCRIAVEHGKFRMAWIGLVDPQTGEIKVTRYAGAEEGYLANAYITVRDEPAGRGPTGTAVREARTIICDDMEHDPRMGPWRTAALKRGYRSSAAVPIFKNGTVIGALTLYGAEPYFFSAEIVKLIEEVTGDITFALENLEKAERRREAEERFEAMFQLSPIPITLATFDEGRYVAANEAALKTLGYRREEMIGKLTRDLPFWADSEQRPAFIQAMNEHRRFVDHEIKYRKKSGEVGEAVMSAVLIELRGQTFNLGMFLDVTERRKVEAALRESEERYRTLIEHASDGIFLTDAQGYFIDANTSGCQLLGYTREDILGVHLVNLIAADTLPNQPLQIDILRSGKSLTTERVLKRKDGSLIPVEISARMLPNGDLLGIVRNIIERKQADEALRQSREMFSKAFHVGPTGLTITRASDGKFINANLAFCEMFEYRSDEVIGHTPTELNIWTPDERDTLTQKEQKSGGLRNFELIARTKSGKQINVLLSSKEMWISGEAHYMTALIDITDRKRAEGEVRTLNAELEQHVADRTAELERAKDRLEAIFNHSSEAILLLDINEGIQQVNYTFGELFGIESEGSIGARLSTFFRPDESAIIETYLAEVSRAHQIRRIEVQARHADGSGFDAELSIAPINRSERAVTSMVCIIRDITERKTVEREMKYHASLQATVSDAVIVTDMDLHIQSWNVAAERIYGWQAQEVLGKHVSDLLRSEIQNPAELDRYRQQLREQGWWQGEITHRHKDGSIRYILSSMSLVRDDQGEIDALVAVNHDITERKQSERALRESEHRLKTVIENIPVRLFWKDQNLVYQGCNSLHAHANGLASPDVIIGKTDFDFQPERAVELQATEHQIVQTGLSSLNVERLTHDRDGTPHWERFSKVPLYDVEGKIVGVLGTIEDITAQKQSELAIAEERNLLRTVIDTVPDFIYVKDRQHRMLLNNIAHARSLGGLSPDEAFGKTDFDSFPAEMAEKFWADEERLFNSDQPVLSTEERSLGQDGSEIWALTSKVPLRNLHGETIGLVGITHDMTVTRAREEALRRSEQQLQESRKMLQLVLDTIPVRVFWKDRNSVYLGCNRLFAEDVGLASTADIVGKRDANLPWPTEEASGYRADDLSVMESGIPKLDYEETRKTLTNTPRFVQTNKLPLRDADDRVIGILGSYIDITRRKQAEAALAQKLQAEHEMQTYLTALHNITVRLARTETLDAFYHAVVEEGLRQFGFERMGMLLYNPADGSAAGTYGTNADGNLVPEYDLRIEPENMTEMFKRTLERPDQIVIREDAELLANLKVIGIGQNAVAALWNGEAEALGWLPVDNGVHHRRITGAQLDVLKLYAMAVGSLLARKRVEFALRESEERFRLLAENVSDVIAKFTPDGTFTYVTPSVYTSFGYRPEEVIGHRLAEFAHPEDREVASPERLISDGDSSFTIALRIMHKAGHTMWIEAKNTLLRDKDTGLVEESIAVYRDISLRKQSESALQQALAQEKELVELKSRFVSMASHEFRTPLATILATTETLSAYRNRLDDSQIGVRLGKIRDQVLHMKEIMEDFLQLSRFQAGRADFNPMLGDLDELCRDIVEEFESQPQYQDRIRYECATTPLNLVLDMRLMRRVISNLVSNALKYSKDNEPVQLTVTNDTVYTSIEVRDQGIGIPEADLKHLFEPFHRASNVGTISGTGLGLSITKQAVELHNGMITARSQVGVGSTFIVIIPSVLKLPENP